METSKVDKWVELITKRIEELEKKVEKAKEDGRYSDIREIEIIIKINKKMLGKHE
jgi:hypothetical protein